MRKWRVLLVGALICTIWTGTGAQQKPGDVLVLGPSTFWRYHYALKPAVVSKDGRVEKLELVTSKRFRDGRSEGVGRWLDFETPLPPMDWSKADFDDTGWARNILFDPDSAWVAHLAVRGKFHVERPEQVGALRLSVRYRGGVVVYLNGTELARGHLGKEAGPEDLAEAYADGVRKSDRALSGIAIPRGLVRKGANVLALAVHRSAVPSTWVSLDARGMTAIAGGTCGLLDVRLTASARDGLTPNVGRPAGVQVWNSDSMSPDYECDYGDPNEALHAIRIVATRNGVGSGKVVIGSDQAIAGLKARAEGLVSADGAHRIADSQVAVRYGLPTVRGPGGMRGSGVAAYRFDALEEAAPESVPVRRAKVRLDSVVLLSGAVIPVWVTVSVGADAEPGDYVGKLTIEATGMDAIEVPIALKVCSWEVPDASRYRIFTEVLQSPETLAMAYRVPLWSEEHFRLIEKSLRLLGEVGNDSCYIPLICESNMGNDESMVRWIKQADGSYTYDFSIMDRYLDLVQKYQGKPEVVCFFVWDTYLEGGLIGGGLTKWSGKEVIAERQAHKGKGPIVSLWDAKTQKAVKHVLPMYREAESVGLWRPLMSGIHRRMKKRGLDGRMMLGCVTDQFPSENVVTLFETISPGTKWVCHGHLRFQQRIRGIPIGYASSPFASGVPLFAEDPTVERMYGWKGEDLETHFPRHVRNEFCPTTWRYLGEMNATGSRRGFSRLGGDFFPVLTDRRGRKVGILSGRFPKTFWRQLNILNRLVDQGKAGPISTARLAVMREGLQECEARIVIEDALLDAKKRAKLGEKRARELQALLDERQRNTRRAVSTLRAVKGTSRCYCYTSGSWWNFAPVVGSQWFVSTDWQSETEKLYEAASEVVRKLR